MHSCRTLGRPPLHNSSASVTENILTSAAGQMRTFGAMPCAMVCEIDVVSCSALAQPWIMKPAMKAVSGLPTPADTVLRAPDGLQDQLHLQRRRKR